jgi:ubiquinone biosynthesis protein
MNLINDTKREPRKKWHFKRYRQIAMVLARYRLEEVLRYVGLQKYLSLRWLLRGNPWRKMVYTKPQRMRLAIEELGTFFVKLGQILSTRSDLLPPAYTKELSKLQSSLKPLPVEVMKGVIVQELGRSIEEVFHDFDANPVGVASIGQVYACKTADDSDVVVKIQKPGVPEQIEEDMYILGRSAAAATKHWKGAQQYDLVGIAQEISDTIATEIDYIQEGHNAEFFADFFQKDRNVHVPRIVWDSTTSRVLTMERIRGIGILNLQALDKAGFDRKELAKRSVGLWLKMVFECEAFHADPHPGNLFVEPDGRLGLIDFGMIVMIDDEVRWNLANALKAIVDRNPDVLIDALIELGAINLREETCRACLRKDIKYVMVHHPTIHLQKPSDSINSSLEQLFTLLRRNNIQLPSNSFHMLKTIVMAQSLGRGLDPQFDILPMLEASVKGIISKKYSISSAIGRLPSAAAELVSLAGGLPQRLNRLMKSVERGEIRIKTDVSGVEKHIHHLELLVNRALIGIIAAALILGLALFFVGSRLGR